MGKAVLVEMLYVMKRLEEMGWVIWNDDESLAQLLSQSSTSPSPSLL